MKFRTELQIQKSDINISYSDSLILLGSCFSENIGNKLNQIKYPTTVNPLGIVYHPLPLHNSILEAIQGKKIDKSDLNENIDSQYTAWNIHSRLSSLDAEETIFQMNNGIRQLCKSIKKANYLILTYGTAYYYDHKLYGPVANCHKFPSTDFKKKLSNPAELNRSFNEMYTKVKEVNANIKLVLTVSPVRHIKDGLVENNRSKAHLLTAVHKICDQHNDCHYLPSYELLLDDLRDYRFYADDMIHPSTKALDYIWNKISCQILDPAEKRLREDIIKIVRAASHRPFNGDSVQHAKFTTSQNTAIKKILVAYPKLDFSEEIKAFKN